MPTKKEPTESGGTPIQVPHDHPLVTALAAQKQLVQDLKAKLAKPSAPKDEAGNGDSDLQAQLDQLRTELASEREARITAETTASEAAIDRLRAARIAQRPENIPAAVVTKLVSVLTGTDEAAIDKEIEEWLPILNIGTGGPRPNPQQGNPSQGRGGSIATGRERYAAAHSGNK